MIASGVNPRHSTLFAFDRECTAETHLQHMQQEVLFVTEFTRTQEGKTMMLQLGQIHLET